MNRNLHQVDHIFKEALEQWEELPARKLWSTIEGRLEQEQSQAKPYKGIFIKSIVLVLILLLVSKNIYHAAIKNPPASINYISSPNFEKIKFGEKTMKQEIVSKTKAGIDSFKRNSFSEEVLNVSRSNAFISSEAEDRILKSVPLRPGNASINPPLEAFNGLLSTPIDEKRTLDLHARDIGSKNEHANQLTSSAFSIGLFFSQAITSYHLKESLKSNQLNRNEFKNSEEQELSTIAGVLVSYDLNKHWTLQTGINFSNTIILIDPKTIYAEEDGKGNIQYRYNSSSGYAYVLPSFSTAPNIGDSLYTLEASHSLKYLGIPLGGKFYFKKGKLSFFASADATINLLLRGEIETSIEDGINTEIEVIRKLNGLKKIYFSLSTEIGVEYQLSNRFSFELAPSARFALNSINKQTLVKSYPYSLGVATGIRYRF